MPYHRYHTTLDKTTQQEGRGHKRNTTPHALVQVHNVISLRIYSHTHVHAFHGTSHSHGPSHSKSHGITWELIYQALTAPELLRPTRLQTLRMAFHLPPRILFSLMCATRAPNTVMSHDAVSCKHRFSGRHDPVHSPATATHQHSRHMRHRVFALLGSVLEFDGIAFVNKTRKV